MSKYYVYVNDTYVDKTDDASEGYRMAFNFCDAIGLDYKDNTPNGPKIRFKTKEQHEATQ